MEEKQRSDMLKIIAILSMLMDHIGYTFFPQFIIFRIIGRIAFPVFAYQIAKGYSHTSNTRNYMIRIWIFAAISQAPFSLLFQTSTLNVLVTLGTALIALDLYKKKHYILLLLPLAASYFIPMDYSIFGPLMVLAFYILRDKPWLSLVAQIVLIAGIVQVYHWPTQYYAVLGAILVIFLPVQYFKVRLPKYFFYWFYPVHLTILYLLRLAF